MARKPDIQYIRYYTDGSAARQVELKPQRKRSVLPKQRKQKKRVVYIDPLALGGIVVSAVMLVLMAVGCIQLFAAQQQAAAMEQYVSQLHQQHIDLTDTYENGYDLEAVQTRALALGMIPQEQAATVTIQVSQTQAEDAPGFWERLAAFFDGLSA